MIHYLMPLGAMGDLPEDSLVDTNKDTVALVDSDPSEEEEVTTPLVRKRKRKSKRRRSTSPALSTNSSASSWSMADATSSFKKVCSTMMSTFESNMKRMSASKTKQEPEEGTRALTALRLITTKKKLMKAIKELREDSEADEDDISLLQLSLQRVTKQIRDQIRSMHDEHVL